MALDSNVDDNYRLDLFATSEWDDIPESFIGIRDPDLVVKAYNFVASDIDSLPWEPEVFSVSFDTDKKDFSFVQQSNSCIEDTLVNDNRGSNFTLVSLYNSCINTAIRRPWLLGKNENQGSYYGICPAVSKDIATYSVTSLVTNTPSIRKNIEDNDITGADSNIKGEKICAITNIMEALLSSDNSISIKSVYEVPELGDDGRPVKDEQGNLKNIWVSLSDEKYFGKLKHTDDQDHKDYGKYNAKFDVKGCIKSKADITVNGRKVSISSDECSSNDIPGFLDQKLVSYDEVMDSQEDLTEIPGVDDQDKDEILTFGVNFSTSERLAPCADSEVPTNHKVMVGSIDIPKSTFAGGMVAVQDCNPKKEDTPHYLNHKLISEESDECVPIELAQLEVKIPCGGEGKMNALNISIKKKDVSNELKLGASLSKVFKVSNDYSTLTITIEDVDPNKYGYLQKTADGWILSEASPDNNFLPGEGISFSHPDNSPVIINTALTKGNHISLKSTTLDSQIGNTSIEIACTLQDGPGITIGTDGKLTLNYDPSFLAIADNKLTVDKDKLLSGIAGAGLLYDSTNKNLNINYNNEHFNITEGKLTLIKTSVFNEGGGISITKNKDNETISVNCENPLYINNNNNKLSLDTKKLAELIAGAGLYVNGSTLAVEVAKKGGLMIGPNGLMLATLVDSNLTDGAATEIVGTDFNSSGQARKQKINVLVDNDTIKVDSSNRLTGTKYTAGSYISIDTDGAISVNYNSLASAIYNYILKKAVTCE